MLSHVDTNAVLTGRTESHLALVPESKHRMHQASVEAFCRLREHAHEAGFELEIVSSFRSFDAQMQIWNRKARGERALLDRVGRPLDYTKLCERDIVYAILNWSALPGASRHHWGTDIDVIDRASVPPRYEIQLTPEEVKPGGMFGPLHDWLDRHMGKYGFYRPYQKDLGGVQPERWHLSHYPTSQALFASHSEAILRQTLVAHPLHLQQVVLAELAEIFDRFFRRISDAPK